MSQNKTSDKLDRQSSMEFGRFLGWLKRTDPELYDMLRQSAEKAGVELHKYIAYLLRYVLEIQKIREREWTLEDLMFCLDISGRLYGLAMKMMGTHLEWLFTDYITVYSSLARAVKEREDVKAERLSMTLEKLFDTVQRIAQNIGQQIATIMSLPYQSTKYLNIGQSTVGQTHAGQGTAEDSSVRRPDTADKEENASEAEK